jgi:hypothetical protein
MLVAARESRDSGEIVGGPAASGLPVRACRCDRKAPRMDRRLAQRNLISGLIVGGLALLAFGFAFFFAVLYITQ